MTEERPPIRIGTAERNAAMKALDEHLAEGRLDIEEYGERSARAASAVTAPELAALFDDLPAPHPRLPGVVGPSLPAVTTPEPTGRPDALAFWTPRLLWLAPLIGVALVLLTRQPLFFLLIPAVGIAFGSRRHGDHRDR